MSIQNIAPLYFDRFLLQLYHNLKNHPAYAIMECIDRLPVRVRTQTGVNAVILRKAPLPCRSLHPHPHVYKQDLSMFPA